MNLDRPEHNTTKAESCNRQFFKVQSSAETRSLNRHEWKSFCGASRIHEAQEPAAGTCNGSVRIMLDIG